VSGPVTNWYIDGFNLYYRLLRGHVPGKWLDLEALARTVFPADTIGAIKYFTARIKALDDPQAPQRQQVYLEALGTLPRVEIHLGFFQINRRLRRLADPRPDGPTAVEVMLAEEKGSDVNLATHLVADAATRACERAVVVTNDADLAEPIRMATHIFGAYTVLLHPSDAPAKVLVNAGPSEVQRLWRSTVLKAQFPDVVGAGRRRITKPEDW
jgi:hypothetical protein